MNVLIMVLSSKKPPYDMLEQAQRETWDSVNVEGVSTYYYYGNDYNMMHHAFKLALQEVWDKNWDVIFRTNSSTYVRKDRIKKYVESIDLSGSLYSGFSTGEMISGTGILLNRNTASILLHELDEYPSPSEDCLIGSILIKHGVYPKQALTRKHYNFQENIIEDADYYRCKSEIKMDGTFGHENLDRTYDVKAMKHLFKHFTTFNT